MNIKCIFGRHKRLGFHQFGQWEPYLKVEIYDYQTKELQEIKIIQKNKCEKCGKERIKNRDHNIRDLILPPWANGSYRMRFK